MHVCVHMCVCYPDANCLCFAQQVRIQVEFWVLRPSPVRHGTASCRLLILPEEDLPALVVTSHWVSVTAQWQPKHFRAFSLHVCMCICASACENILVSKTRFPHCCGRCQHRTYDTNIEQESLRNVEEEIGRNADCAVAVSNLVHT